MKTKTITVSPVPGVLNRGPQNFMIQKVTDTVEYVPGRSIPENELKALCSSNQWKVTIVRTAA